MSNLIIGTIQWNLSYKHPTVNKRIRKKISCLLWYKLNIKYKIIRRIVSSSTMIITKPYTISYKRIGTIEFGESERMTTLYP